MNSTVLSLMNHSFQELYRPFQAFPVAVSSDQVQGGVVLGDYPEDYRV